MFSIKNSLSKFQASVLLILKIEQFTKILYKIRWIITQL